MTDSARAFRDYATRVSFNMSLSRNQVGHLAAVICEIELEGLGDYSSDNKEWLGRYDAKEQACLDAGGRPNHFIVGRGSLSRMGLIEQDPRNVAENARLDDLEKKGQRRTRKYYGPNWRLTPAGEHVAELLRIAGLIPKAAANANRKKRRAA